MTEDDASPDSLDRLVTRIDRLERALDAQTTRLQQIERYLGQSTQTPAPEARDTTRHATDDQTTDAVSDAGRRVETPRPAPPSATNADTADSRAAQPPATPPPAPDAHTAHAPAAPGGGATGRRLAGTTGAATGAGAAGGRRAQGATAAAHVSASESKSLFDLENLIGGSLAAWVGIIASCFGVAFFLKEAFEREWIGPAGRVLLGAAAGVGVVALGERLRQRGMRQYAYILTGGGILILYLSTYAAYGFYQLINQVFAFLLMVGVTATAVLLAARHHALPIAMLGLVGGFLTPILLSTGRDNAIGLFSYIALLDAGVLALAYLKRWRSLYYTSFAATLLMILGWMTIHYQTPKLWTTLFFLSLFFLLFSLLAVVHNVLPRRRAQWLDITLIISNATFYFGISYNLLEDADYDAALGSFALVLSAFYILLYYAAWSRHRADRLLIYSLLGAAITFFTVAVAIQLDQQWVTIAWATEAALLTWIGLRSQTDAPRHAALVVFAIALARWFLQDLPADAATNNAAFVPLLNARAASCAALVGACAFIVWLYRRAGADVEESERSTLANFFMLAGNVVAFTLLTSDVYDYFVPQKMRAMAEGVQTTYADAWQRIENTRQFSLTVLWTLYATTALAIGIVRRLKPLRVVALALLAFTVLKAFMLDLRFYDAAWHTPLFNHTFLGFALLVVALGIVASLYSRESSHVAEGERARVLPVLLVAANLLALVALSAEASGYFERRVASAAAANVAASVDENAALNDLRLAQQLALSILWMAYGASMLAFGHLRRNGLLRLMALLLLGATTLKVFFWDLASLDRVYRIISFIVLGLILLAISYLYQKSQQRAPGEETGQTREAGDDAAENV